jgi:hypothetical protein
MKLLTISLIVLSSVAAPAFANLDETFAESVARYGKPDAVDQNSASWVLDKDHTIGAWFIDAGVCDAIAYNNFIGFGDDELITTVSQNVPTTDGYREKKVAVGRYWGTASHRIGALLYTRNNHGEGRNPQVLLIRTVAYFDRIEQAAKADAEAAKPAVKPKKTTKI